MSALYWLCFSIIMIPLFGRENCRGMSEERLSLLGDWIDDRIENNEFTGASIVVYRKNSLVYESYHGYNSLHKTTTINENTVFRILSMSKPVTAVGLLMIYEKNKFKLTDPVSKYIPSFDKDTIRIYDYNGNKNIDLDNMSLDNIKTIPVNGSGIQIWHLLAHTAGLSYGFDPTGVIQPVDILYQKHIYPILLSGEGVRLEEFVDALATMPLLFEPGTEFEYSFSIAVAGRLIEILSGQSLDVYFRENIFKPLNMKDTAFKFSDFPNIDQRLPTLYSQTENGSIVPLTAWDVQYYDEYKYLGPDQGLLSTLHDYLQFAKMLLHGGKLPGKSSKRLLSAKTVKLMSMNHLLGNQDIKSVLHKHSVLQHTQSLWRNGVGYGLGVSVVINQRLSDGIDAFSSIGDYGWSGASECWFRIDPEQDMCFVFMTQLDISYRELLDPEQALRTFIYSAITDDSE